MPLPVDELRGRSAEIALVRDHLDAAREGRGRILVVSGEAGIGKSALAEVAVALAERAGFRILTGRAWEFADAPAYFPVRSGLRALGVTPALPAASDADAFGLWEDVLEALARESNQKPIAWLIEDLHAADAQTLELFAFLSQPLRALPVLVLATVRTGDASAAAALPRLTRLMRDASMIELPRLGAVEVAALAAEVAGRALPSGSVGAWMERTGGNPLFVVECARAVRAGRSVEGALPATVVQLVVERLHALPAPTRAFLEQGAVLGRDFAAVTIARIAERLPAVVIDSLSPALRSGLLEETSPGRFRFGHALVRDAIEESMPPERRRECHARAEAALAEQGDAMDVLVERARHAIDGLGVIDEAVAGALVTRAIAALEAEAARDRALSLFRRWLDARSKKPAPADLIEAARLATAAGSHGEAQRAAEAALAAARSVRDPLAFAEAALASGAVLRPGVKDPALVAALEEALAGLPPGKAPALECRVRARLAAALQPATDPRIPVAMAREAIAAARANGDPALLRNVLLVAGSALTFFASVVETHAIAEELLTLALAAGEPGLVLHTYARRIMGHLELGDFAALDADADRMLALARTVGHPSLVWRPLLVGSMRALARGQFEESERFVTEVEQMATLSDDPALPTSLLAHRTNRVLALDDQTEMRRVLTDWAPAIQRSAGEFSASALCSFAVRLEDHRLASGYVPTLMRFVALMPADASMLGNIGEAVAFAGTDANRAVLLERLRHLEGREVHSSHVPYTYEGPIARIIGLLEASLGRHEEAAARFEAARERCRTLGLRPWVARLSLERGRSLLAAGRAAEARPVLEEAAALAEELRMNVTEQRARRAIGEFTAARPEATGAAPATTPPAPASDQGPVELAREGELWRIEWAGHIARVRDSRGVQLLAKLVASPGARIHALALAGDAEGFVPESDAGEALDQKAVAAYRRRLTAIDEDLATAESRGDARRAEQLGRERQALVAEITRAVGLGGRLRKVGSATERARINVTRRLKDAIGRIAEADAPLGRHLEGVIRTGTYCSYLKQ